MNIHVIKISATFLDELRKSVAALPGVEAETFRGELESLAAGKVASLLMTTGTDDLSSPEEPLRVRDLVIDPRRHEVSRAGVLIDLTAKEFEILYFLAQNRGQVFTKEQIYTAVWEGKYYLDDSNIMSFIRKIRKKLEPDPDAPVYIMTIWGVGYKFADD